MVDGPTQMGTSSTEREWVARPIVAGLTKLAIVLGPIIVSVGFGSWASQTFPPHRLQLNPWIWWLGLLAVATVLVRLLHRAFHHLAPLTMLFRLSLIFPDQTPTRFGAALRAGTITSTKKRIEAIQRGGHALDGDDSISLQMLDLITMLSRHDRMTRGHAERVRSYAELIGEEMGIVGRDLDRLRWAALLHDMGKLDVPTEILNKDGRPTEAEWEILKGHPAAAERHLAPIATWLGEWRHAADGHHEKWDGSGYPRGLAGLDIPLAARIVAVADAYDVMTSTRSYKVPIRAEIARREIADNAGSQFDPVVARAFLRLSLGDLRRVGGPVAWFASLPGIRQIPIATAAAPISTAITAAATAIAVALGGVPETPIVENPPAIAFADESADVAKPTVSSTAPPSPPVSTSTSAPAPSTSTPTTSTPTSTTPTAPTSTTTAPTTTSTTAAPTTAAPTTPTSTTAAPMTTTTTAPTTTTTTTVPVNTRPRFDDQTLRLAENMPAGGTGQFVVATDDGTLAFSTLTASTPFIVGSDGELLVDDPVRLDFEAQDSWQLDVVVTDGVYTETAIVTILVDDVNEAPFGSAQSFQAFEVDPAGTFVGSFTVSDPEANSIEVGIEDATNPDLDGDGQRAYAASITGDVVTISIDDPDDVDHGVAGQAPTLAVQLTDEFGSSSSAEVQVSTQSRFGLSPRFGEIIISEVRWASHPQFVELVNVHDQPVDVSNWIIADYAHGTDPAETNSINITPIPPNPAGLDPGQRVLFWMGVQPDPDTAGIEFEAGNTNLALGASDDIWVLDENGRIVAYMAWGTDTIQDTSNAIGDRPPIVAWGLWDPSAEASLGSGPGVAVSESIAVSIESAAASQNSACWEATASGAAAARCVGATLTVSTNPGPNRVSSPGRQNY